MASLVARAAAALPSGRARRLGSARLPMVVALPSHGAVVRARRPEGRRGRGHGGVLLPVEFKAPSSDVRAVCTKDGADPPSMGDENEKLKEIAEKCIALVHDAMSRLPRAEWCRLRHVFIMARFAFAVVRSRATDGRASMGMAVVIAEKLYVVLKAVSSGCSTPLPLDVKKEKKMLIPLTAPVFPLDHGVEVLVFDIIDNLYNAVKKDIDDMISDAPRA